MRTLLIIHHGFLLGMARRITRGMWYASLLSVTTGADSASWLSTTSTTLSMIFLLFVYSLTQSDPGDASPISSIPSIKPRADDFSCNDINNCRTISNIVWSCFSTIFLCTWVSLHPNITIARDTRGMGWFKKSVVHPLRAFMKSRLPLFLCALIAPEYILAWAIRQYLKAGDIKQKVPGWTRTHGYFVLMGGFHLYRLPSTALSKPYPPEFALRTAFAIVEPLTPHSREDEIAEYPLNFADLSIRALAYLAPSETELRDRGKADVLAKVIALIQTLWFIAQCIARGINHLPLTEIEVVTLAYTTVNVFIYYFWWDKPKDVECPVRVYKTLKAGPVRQKGESGTSGIVKRSLYYIAGVQDGFFRLSEESQVPMFWSGDAGEEVASRAMLGASIIGIAFGAVHFIAWNSEFPSRIEVFLWRISCIAMTADLLTLAVFCSLYTLDRHMWVEIIVVVIEFSAPLIALLYLLSRIATLVIAFTTLRALPFDAFKTVDWITFIPHF